MSEANNGAKGLGSRRRPLADQQSDLERLLGPDRRQLRRPKGLGLLIVAIAAVILIGMVAMWPGTGPILDLTTFGFAEDFVEAEVTERSNTGCSYASDLECRQYVFEETPETISSQSRAPRTDQKA